MRALARRPAQELSVREMRVTPASLEPWQRIVRVETPARARDIELDVGVMNARRTRPELDAFDVAIARKGYGDHEAADHVGAFGGQHEALGHRRDQIGAAQFPFG